MRKGGVNMSDVELGATKVELRRSLLQTRQAISTHQWRQMSDRVCEWVRSSPQFQQARTVLAYFSTRQEVDLSPLFTEVKVWGFPRCVQRELVWHQWHPQSQWPRHIGKFGILEPHPESPQLQPSQVDLILVPAVACDSRGFRLGYGGGFYDRMLSSEAWQNKATIAILFEAAKLPSLPRDPWDRPLQAICTEAGLLMVE